MNDERERTRFLTWVHKEFGPVKDSQLLPMWMAWQAAKLVDDRRKRVAEPLTLDDGSTIEFNTYFADLEGKE